MSDDRDIVIEPNADAPVGASVTSAVVSEPGAAEVVTEFYDERGNVVATTITSAPEPAPKAKGAAWTRL